MFCSTSVTVHLLRGVGAIGMVLLAVILPPYGLIWSGLALAGAVVLLRGCPMCWLMGLIETVKATQKESTNKKCQSI